MSSSLDAILRKYVNGEKGATDAVQGAAFIVTGKDGKTIYSRALGKLNFEADSPPFAEDSISWIASMTKLVTAVSIMQLVEKGMIGLDDDVGKIVPQLSNMDVLTGFDDAGAAIMQKQNKPLTLRHLLSHSSGMVYDQMDPDLIKWSATVGRTVTADAYTLEGYTFPLKFQPGEGWSYGVGLDWVGHLVEVLSKQKLEDYMQEHIFKPLHMSSTTFRIASRPDLAPRRAVVGFRAEPRGPLTAGTLPLPDVQPKDGSGSGLFSTAADYMKLLSALLNNGSDLLRPDSVRELHTPQLPDNKYLMENFSGPWHDFLCPEYPRGLQANYGLGGAINVEDLPGRRTKGSLMWSGMSNPHWWIDWETGVAATLFTQILPPADQVVIEMLDELERAVYKELVA